MHGWSGSLINVPYGAYLDHCYAWNLQPHFLRVFVANLKNDAIYGFNPESFCDKNLAIRKVFAFSDSEETLYSGLLADMRIFYLLIYLMKWGKFSTFRFNHLTPSAGLSCRYLNVLLSHWSFLGLHLWYILCREHCTSLRCILFRKKYISTLLWFLALLDLLWMVGMYYWAGTQFPEERNQTSNRRNLKSKGGHQILPSGFFLLRGGRGTAQFR